MFSGDDGLKVFVFVEVVVKFVVECWVVSMDEI